MFSKRMWINQNAHIDRQSCVTLGLDFTSFFFFVCCVFGASESESSSESDSEPEELSADELLVWATGPFPFSSESLKQNRRTATHGFRRGVDTTERHFCQNNEIVSRHNELVSRYELVCQYNEFVYRHNKLVSRYDELVA